MAPQLTCVTCIGSFGPTMFVDRYNLVCRICQMRDKMSEELNAAYRKIDVLTTKVETLSEFVSLNVVPSTPGPATSPASPDTNNTDANIASVPSQEDFQVVRNNVTPKRRSYRLLDVKIDSRSFQIPLTTMRKSGLLAIL